MPFPPDEKHSKITGSDVVAIAELAFRAGQFSAKKAAAADMKAKDRKARDTEPDDRAKLSDEYLQALKRTERAEDAAFASRHPSTAGIKTNAPAPRRKKSVSTSTASAESFAKRFPELVRVKVSIL